MCLLKMCFNPDDGKIQINLPSNQPTLIFSIIPHSNMALHYLNEWNSLQFYKPIWCLRTQNDDPVTDVSDTSHAVNMCVLQHTYLFASIIRHGICICVTNVASVKFINVFEPFLQEQKERKKDQKIKTVMWQRMKIYIHK